MDGQVSARGRDEGYPDFTEELEFLENEGPSAAVVRRILEKHAARAAFDRGLYERYRGGEVPIFSRAARFEGEEKAINNRLNNDFFGEIVDFKTGFFAGKPIGYTYADTRESRQVTARGGRREAPAGAEGAPHGRGEDAAVRAAQKALTDFTARSNMFDVDMECTKYAACCGYAARLFYIDPEGCERVMPVAPFEAAILFKRDMSEPQAAVRYFRREKGDKLVWYAELYDERFVTCFEGESLEKLEVCEKSRAHLLQGCPLQGIANNGEMCSDGEKQLALIDAYDRALSDANNESESFAQAYMVYENVDIDEEQMRAGQRSGAIKFYNGAGAPGRIYFVTKDVNDAFVEHHLDRLEENIYRFSKTPNLHDKQFAGNASGVALKYKLAALETKCGMWQAKVMGAGVYMFRLLCGVWQKKGIVADPLQCVMDFHRNFPLDTADEAQAVKTLVEAGVPQRVAFSQLSFVDDVAYLLQEPEGGEEGDEDGEI